MYWPEQQALILSDMHLGKGAHFRKHGIAIPHDVSVHDVERLDNLIEHFMPEQVIFVGDLVHAGSNTEVIGFKSLTSKWSDIRFILVEGNHDRMKLERYAEIGIHEVLKGMIIDGVELCHEPNPSTPIPRISGHLHPGISLYLPNKKVVKLPCFLVSTNQLVLPAFSIFTGLDTQSEIRGAERYAFDNQRFYHFLK